MKILFALAWLFVFALTFLFALVCLPFVMVAALIVFVIRGKKSIGWSKPSECKDFFTWMQSDWNYYSNGRQSGIRLFGLEVASSGRLW